MKNRILLLVAVLCISLVAVHATASSQWYISTDTGMNMAINDVDYFMRVDDSARFTIVMKDGNTVTGVSSVVVSQLQSVGQHMSDNYAEIRIYPNPVKDRIFISGITEGLQIDVISLGGKLMKSIKSEGSEIVLTVSDLPQGTYLLRTANSTFKFIKQ